MIIVYAVFIGVETEYRSSHAESSTWFLIIGNLLSGWFLVEILLRTRVEGCRKWITSADRTWNCFDLCLVSLWLIDLAILLFVMNGGFARASQNVQAARALRALRLFRLFRALRVFRVARLSMHVRKMVGAFFGSVSTLFWCLILLIFELYFFAACFVQGLNSYRHEEGATVSDDLIGYFGNMRLAYYSLYMAITGGLNWHVLLDALNSLPTGLYAAIFFVYISITFFGALNVITAVFIDSAMQAAASQRDLVVDEKRRNDAIYVSHLKSIFEEMDTDKSGLLSMSEMNEVIADDSLGGLLAALELTPPDARSLFKLLDSDGSEAVDIEEFCAGCLQLKGGARSFDIQCLLYESRRQIEKLTHLMVSADHAFTDLKKSSTFIKKSCSRAVSVAEQLHASPAQSFRGLHL